MIRRFVAGLGAALFFLFLSGICATALAQQAAQDAALSLPTPVSGAVVSQVAAPPVTQLSTSPPTPAAPLSAPTLVDGSAISAGDTAWLLMSTALVLLMTLPDVAMFYAGMVRKKNALGNMAHSFAACCVVTLIWVVIGYSLAFTPGSQYIGVLGRFMLRDLEYVKSTGQVSVHHVAPTVPESVFMMFQMTFAIITAALITGAIASA